MLSTHILFAQPEDRQEKIKAAKIGMITNRLNLTTEQAQNFWPIYNEYDEARENLRKAERDLKDNFSDKKPEQTLDEYIKIKEKELDLLKKYKDKFLEVISAEQLLALYKAEHDFTRMLIERLGDGPPPRRR